MHASAQIIPLPTAALLPIVQKNGPGRYPKKVVSYPTFWRKKRDREGAAVVRAKEIKNKLEALDDLERFVCVRRQQLNALAKSATPIPR